MIHRYTVTGWVFALVQGSLAARETQCFASHANPIVAKMCLLSSLISYRLLLSRFDEVTYVPECKTWPRESPQRKFTSCRIKALACDKKVAYIDAIFKIGWIKDTLAYVYVPPLASIEVHKCSDKWSEMVSLSCIHPALQIDDPFKSSQFFKVRKSVVVFVCCNLLFSTWQLSTFPFHSLQTPPPPSVYMQGDILTFACSCASL